MLEGARKGSVIVLLVEERLLEIKEVVEFGCSVVEKFIEEK